MFMVAARTRAPNSYPRLGIFKVNIWAKHAKIAVSMEHLGKTMENPNKNAGFKLGQSLNQMGDSPASHVDYRRVSKK